LGICLKLDILFKSLENEENEKEKNFNFDFFDFYSVFYLSFKKEGSKNRERVLFSKSFCLFKDLAEFARVYFC
jgi:uncharacterized protein (DUF2225 family)